MESIKQSYFRPLIVHVRSFSETARVTMLTCISSLMFQSQMYDELCKGGTYFDSVVDGEGLSDRIAQLDAGPRVLITKLRDRAWNSDNNMYL